VLSVEKKVDLDGSNNDGNGNCILFVGWEKPKGNVFVPTKLERIVLLAAVVDECNSRRRVVLVIILLATYFPTRSARSLVSEIGGCGIHGKK